MQVQLVVDQRTGLHRDGTGRKDAKTEGRRRDLFEVVGVGKEGKDLFSVPWNEERSFEKIGHFLRYRSAIQISRCSDKFRTGAHSGESGHAMHSERSKKPA
jgi:hypothetical protein